MQHPCKKILCCSKTDVRRSVQTADNGFQDRISEKMARQRGISGTLLSYKKDGVKPLESGTTRVRMYQLMKEASQAFY